MTVPIATIYAALGWDENLLEDLQNGEDAPMDGRFDVVADAAMPNKKGVLLANSAIQLWLPAADAQKLLAALWIALEDLHVPMPIHLSAKDHQTAHDIIEERLTARFGPPSGSDEQEGGQ